MSMEARHKAEPKFRKQLNQNQIAILTCLFKAKFGTTQLLAQSLGKKHGGFVHPRLTTLVEQGYIGRRFESSYRLQGKPAAYYLLPKGLRALQANTARTDIDATTIKNSYKDKTASEEFIAHSLAVYAIHNQLKAVYPAMKLFTKRELTIYDYFPKVLPDLYLSLKVGAETRRFLLELCEDSTPPFVVNRRLRQLIAYYQDELWQAKGSPFPPILFVCETAKCERRLRKQINRALFRAGEEMVFYTTSQSLLMQSAAGDAAIWSSSEEPEEVLLPLDELS